jgi:hypothetical protein
MEEELKLKDEELAGEISKVSQANGQRRSLKAQDCSDERISDKEKRRSSDKEGLQIHFEVSKLIDAQNSVKMKLKDAREQLDSIKEKKESLVRNNRALQHHSNILKQGRSRVEEKMTERMELELPPGQGLMERADEEESLFLSEE